MTSEEWMNLKAKALIFRVLGIVLILFALGVVVSTFGFHRPFKITGTYVSSLTAALLCVPFGLVGAVMISASRSASRKARKYLDE